MQHSSRLNFEFSYVVKWKIRVWTSYWEIYWKLNVEDTFERRPSRREFKQKKTVLWSRVVSIPRNDLPWYFYTRCVMPVRRDDIQCGERARETVIVHKRRWYDSSFGVFVVYSVRKRDIFLFTNPVFIISFYIFPPFSVRIRQSTATAPRSKNAK